MQSARFAIEARRDPSRKRDTSCPNSAGFPKSATPRQSHAASRWAQTNFRRAARESRWTSGSSSPSRNACSNCARVTPRRKSRNQRRARRGLGDIASSPSSARRPIFSPPPPADALAGTTARARRATSPKSEIAFLRPIAAPAGGRFPLHQIAQRPPRPRAARDARLRLRPIHNFPALAHGPPGGSARPSVSRNACPPHTRSW